eukprot:GFUD01001366.1.p1 GENE.GFUD01001366.1~~GFUD01001366.1.p1  ORF type:complete len:151 (-),score=43.38 GFUD01001366.1:69-521(-)
MKNTTVEVKLNITGNTNQDSPNSLLQHEVTLTILIPSLFIFIILLVTITIACILHRRHKKRERMMLNTAIFHPRSPIIFASEPGMYDDRVRRHKRLFSDDEDDGNVPDYEVRGDVMRKTLIEKDHEYKIPASQSSRKLSRPVPPYSDSRG